MNTTFFNGVYQLNYGEANTGSEALGSETMSTVLTDLRELTKMLSSGVGTRPYLFVSPDQAVHLASLSMSVGSNEMTALGGTFMGFNVMVSDNLPSGVVVLADPSGIAWWDGGLQEATSSEADLELETGPANKAAPTVTQMC